MASVMALSSVSVVAFADETVTSDIKTEVVSMAQLKEYVKSFETFVDEKLEDYGEVQSGWLNDAIDAANAVIDNRDATDDDVTAAYQMLKSVYENLQLYTQAELQELIEECKRDYETENIMNETFGDKIFKNDNDEWDNFEDAYDRAEAYVDAEDSAEICDAYLELYTAAQNLAELDKVTKSDFRKVYLQYTDMLEKFSDYEDWRRGTCSVNSTTGNLKDSDKNKLDLTAAKFITFGELKDIVQGSSNAALWNMGSVDQDRGIAAQSSGSLWIDINSSVHNDGGSYTTVKAFVEAAYKEFLDKAESNATTDKDILEAYKAAKDAVAVFNGWKADTVKGSSAVVVEDAIDDYRAKILDEYYDSKFAASAISATLTDLEWTGDGKLKIKDTPSTTLTAGSANATVDIMIDPNTKMIAIDANGEYNAGLTGAKTLSTFLGDKLKAGLDLTKYVPVTSKGIQKLIAGLSTGATAQDTQLSTALGVYDLCVVEDNKPNKDDRDYKTAVSSIDDWDTVGSKDRASKAYALVVRKVKYALDDKFPVPGAKKSLSDVYDICKKARDLIEETGEAYMFRTANETLAKIRKSALEWYGIAKADKDYDNTAYNTTETATFDSSNYSSGASSDDVYGKVETAYKELEKLLKQYPDSYGDVAELIADVADGLDADVYGASTASIKASASELARMLSTLDSDGEGNEAFDDDRNFLFYNRLNSKGNKADKALYAKYQALEKAVEEATKEPEKPEVVKGDLTGDGFATPEDAIMIVKAFVGEITLTDAQKAAADFNGDGVVNADDALAVVKAYVGL